MASSSTFSTLLSFILPTPKTPPPPPPQQQPLLPLPLSSTPFQKLSHHHPHPNFEPLPLSSDPFLSPSPSLSNDLSSVMCPSLAYSNTLFFSSAYNVQVVVGDDEPEERLLNRFRREVMKAGVIQECKRRRYFENKQDEKKRKTREAAKRNRRRRPFQRTTVPNKDDVAATKKEDDDNWDLPEGDTAF